MKAGYAFLIKDRSVDGHLWVIISDPEKDSDQILIVNMTTYKSHKEDVCLLEAGDHPWVAHKTCIAYDEARLITLEKLEVLKNNGLISMHTPVSEDVLRRIRDGINLSRIIEYKHIELMIRQRLID